MTQTKKFSQFQGPDPIEDGDIVVGLRVDPDTGLLDNWQFTGVGSGGGGSGGVKQVIDQPGHGFAKGDWVRIDVATMLYVKAQADDDLNAEVIGVVVVGMETNVDQFTLQQSGYVTSADAVFSGLVIGNPYYLDAAVLGGMTNVEPTTDGQVSRPVFIPDGDDKGWVVPYRGNIIGGGTDTSGGGGTGTDSNIVTVTQDGHGFNVGDWVRVTDPDLGLMQPVYILAQADTLANSQSVGVVIEVVNPNQFKLQFSGYNIGAVTQDYLGSDLVPKTVYYLSPTVAGQLTSVNPTALGLISKPLYVSEQVGAGPNSTGINAGYVLPQRPLETSEVNNNDTHTVVKANAFQKGQWVYIAGPGDDTYALAKADTLASSQVAGVIISDFDPNQFTVQQSGWITGAVDGTYVTGAITNGAVLYLSDAIAGNLTTTVPGTAGQISKPCYIQENLATRTGQILPQRPILITAAGGGTGTGPIVQSLTTTVNSHLSLAIPGFTWTNVPSLTRAITPTAATSNLKITVFLTGYSTAAGPFPIRLLRDGVPVASALGTSATLGQNVTTSNSATGGTSHNMSFTAIDPAGSTAATTYSIQIYRELGATIYLHADGNSGTLNSLISTITVEEIL